MSTFLQKANALKVQLAVSRTERERIERIDGMPPRQGARARLEHLIRTARHWPRKPDPAVVRDPLVLGRGWLLPHLLTIDDALWGRWDYWARMMWAGELLDEPIPQIDFDCGAQDGIGSGPCRKMLEASLNSIPRHGEWRGWSHWHYLDYFFDWLLFGFGQLHEPPKEPEPGTFSRLYQVFCLEAMLLWPRDYFGDLMAEQAHGRSQGFYPTPHTVVEMMTRMCQHDCSEDEKLSGRDPRTLSVNDPAVGTGRMLLHSSNFSLRLSGADINATCVKACTVNLWLYAPWGAKSLPFLELPAA